MSASRSRNSSKASSEPAPASGQSALAILGGSSAFTPALAAALADEARDLPPLEIRLHGRNRSRLTAVARFCNRHVRARSIPHEYSYTSSIQEACRDARVIINQIRIGGWAGRTHDERFPLAFGWPGDETIGPGGLASAVRGVPALLEVAQTAKEAAPNAWFINMSNPMGILLAALRRIPGLKSFGLCELPALTLKRALDLAGVPEDSATADYLGLNHQGWFVHLLRDGRDLLSDIFDRVDEPEAARFFKVDASRMREVNALPLPYMRLYYHTSREVERLRDAEGSRGRELDDLSNRLYEAYGRTDDPELPDLIRERSLIWYETALVPAIVALLGGGERLLYVSERNGQDIPGLPEDAVVEKKCTLGPEGARMLPFHGPAPERDGALEPFLAFLRQVVQFEEAALRAALDPRAENVAAALTFHPWGIDEVTARSMVPQVLKSVEELEA